MFAGLIKIFIFLFLNPFLSHKITGNALFYKDFLKNIQK